MGSSSFLTNLNIWIQYIYKEQPTLFKVYKPLTIDHPSYISEITFPQGFLWIFLNKQLPTLKYLFHDTMISWIKVNVTQTVWDMIYLRSQGIQQF